MKTLVGCFRILIFSFTLLCFNAAKLHAVTIVWTNTASGSFGTAANWSPNALPGSGDVAVITNAGNYTVTLDTGRTVGGFQVGANSGGTQSPTIAGYDMH